MSVASIRSPSVDVSCQPPAPPSEEAAPCPYEDRVTIYGDRTRRLRALPEPVSPLPGVLDVEPSLHMLVGKPKSGKTTFSLHLALCWSLGASPWRGAPKLKGSRALFLTREDRAEHVLRTATRLAHSAGIKGWEDRLHVLAGISHAHEEALRLDREERRRLSQLTFDGSGSEGGGGFAALRRLLDGYSRAEDPIGFLVVDSLSQCKPDGCDENSSDDMTPWLRELQAFAVEHSVYVVVIHHPSLAAGSRARGTGAMSAVPRVNLSWGRLRGSPRQRRLRASGNAILERVTNFTVSPPPHPASAIVSFTASLSIYAELDAVWPEEPVSVSTLAVRVDAFRAGAALPAQGSAEERATGTRRTQVSHVLKQAEACGVASSGARGLWTKHGLLSDLDELPDGSTEDACAAEGETEAAF